MIYIITFAFFFICILFSYKFACSFLALNFTEMFNLNLDLELIETNFTQSNKFEACILFVLKRFESNINHF